MHPCPYQRGVNSCTILACMFYLNWRAHDRFGESTSVLDDQPIRVAKFLLFLLSKSISHDRDPVRHSQGFLCREVTYL